MQLESQSCNSCDYEITKSQNNAVFTLELFTAVKYFAYLGKLFVNVNVN